MIVFDLKCSGGHVFEAWFQSSLAFEDQQAAGRIACPACGDIHIVKAIMAPNISLGASRGEAAEREAAQEAANQATKVKTTQPALASLASPEEFKKALEGFKQMVRENCDDVGKNFAEEARKIHYGEVEARGIYGEATRQESKDLQEEGIDFISLPIPIRGDS